MKVCAEQVKLICTTRRTGTVIIALSLVALAVGCTFSHEVDIPAILSDVVHVAFYVLLPVTILVINAMLIREMRRASHNAAANPLTLVLVPVLATEVLILLVVPEAKSSKMFCHYDAFSFRFCVHVTPARNDGEPVITCFLLSANLVSYMALRYEVSTLCLHLRHCRFSGITKSFSLS